MKTLATLSMSEAEADDDLSKVKFAVKLKTT
jgi:hypothetical protein